MTEPFLTIAIPTYNRAAHLDFLLSVLEQEMRGMQGRVQLFITDNASTDATPAIVDKYRDRIPELISQRNDVNRGADFNILECYDRPDSAYVWILGDDDAPIRGALPKLVQLLEQHHPDLMYLPSAGTASVAAEYAKRLVGPCDTVSMERADFAAFVNVQLTFISGLVMRKDAAAGASVRTALETTRGTSLIQLAWVYEILKQGQRFHVATQEMLIATAGNSGGYSVLDVFCVNHTRLVCSLLKDHPRSLHNILRRTSLCFLPGLVWNVRIGTMGQFDMAHRARVSVPDELAAQAGFRLLVQPIWTFPKSVAGLFFQASRVVAKFARLYDRHITMRR
jgi:glycosyltransferase involved in cell wall biosynthesis